MSWFTKLSQSTRLWLDDERDPKDPVIQQYFGSHGDEIWVTTASQAIKMLEQGNITFIDFDNDLGPPEAGEGIDVAKWIEEQAFNGKIKPLGWKVHSMNPKGQINISAAMQSAERFWKENELV